MKINTVSNSPSFNAKFTVNYNENKQVKYLANIISDFAKKEHVPTTFSRDAIELSSVQKSQDTVIAKFLEALKIKFSAK